LNPLADARQRVVFELIEDALAPKSRIQYDLRSAFIELTDQFGVWRHCAQLVQCSFSCLGRNHCDDAAFAG
jgi:hypothetical protein